MKTKKLINAQELAEIVSISRLTVIKLAKEGEIPCTYKGRQPYFDFNALIKHFQRLEGGAA